MVYFRFRRAKKAAMPMMQATATIANIVTSVVISNAFVAVVGSASSGSNCCPADIGSSTIR